MVMQTSVRLIAVRAAVRWRKQGDFVEHFRAFPGLLGAIRNHTQAFDTAQLINP
jgi:hypothetical protein